MATTLYEKYLQNVFVDASQAIYVAIKQNNIKLFDGKNFVKDKTKAKLRSAQTCSKLVTNLFIASQQRDADLDNLLQYEISFPPPSLFSAVEINISKSRSRLVDCLVKKDIVSLPTNVDCSAIVIVGSFIAQSHKPNVLQTLQNTLNGHLYL